VRNERSFALQIASRFRGLLTERFGDRVEDVRLFGSRARGEAHEESDLDVLVLIHGLTRPEKTEVLELAAELGIESGIAVSALAMATVEFERLRSLEARIALDIDREGVPA
jgi:uncharacterized protein